MNLTAIDLMVSESIPAAIQAQTGYSQARRYSFINRGYYKFVMATKCIEDDIDIITVDEQAEYTLTDAANLAYLYKPYEVRYIESGSTDVGYKLKPYPGGHRAIPRVKSYGRPTHYWQKFTNVHDDVIFGTWPINNADGDTITISAFMFPASELATGTDVPVIKEVAHDALAYWAIAEIYRMYEHINPKWGTISRKYKGMFAEEVQSYKYFLFEDNADTLPTFLGNDDTEDWDG